jgi:hypothetical protein
MEVVLLPPPAAAFTTLTLTRAWERLEAALQAVEAVARAFQPCCRAEVTSSGVLTCRHTRPSTLGASQQTCHL